MSNIIDQLMQAFGDKSVLTDSAIGDKYKKDWSGVDGRLPIAVVRPTSTEEVSQVLSLCSEQSQAVVIQGGMTGISAGAVPQEQEIAISLERMNGIIEIDKESMTLTALAGTPLQVIQEAAEDADMYFPLDMGSRGTCTIGGNVATNAGGNQVIRYGPARALTLGLETVLPDGTIISSLNKMLKNNAGFDLKHLFIGSEGTLGIVTKVVVRLYPKANATQTALCALPDFPSVLKLLQQCYGSLGDGVTSFEVMWANYFDEVIDTVEQAQSPFKQHHPFYALIEYQGQDQEQDAEKFAAVLFDAMENGMIADAVLAQSLKEADSFWVIRDGIGELLSVMGHVVNTDISVPISSMQSFMDALEPALYKAFPDIKLRIFGHIGDSNLHVCSGTGLEKDLDAISAIIMGLIGDYKGSVSAEHGIGVLKKKYLHHSRTAEEMALMATLKQALDPKGILNQGRVL
jgi:FAD/FMN-containing dehydrogenase